MSKTVEIQIEKSRGLVEGLRRHVKEMGERGVTNGEINAMDQAIKELEAVNAEVDSIREQLTPAVSAGWTMAFLTSANTILNKLHKGAERDSCCSLNRKMHHGLIPIR